MKSKKNMKEVCEKFNTIRMENLHKTFKSSEIDQLMQPIGLGKSYIAMMKVSDFFRKKRVGKADIYAFHDQPTHFSQFEALGHKYRNYYNKQRTPEVKKTPDVEQLKTLGYIIQKPVGIDIDKLKAKYPKVYADVMKYETL